MKKIPGTPRARDKSTAQRQPSAAMVRAKAAFLERIRLGASVPEALAAAGRTETTYDNWRKNDPGFVAAVAAARKQVRSAKPASRGLDFAEFCDRFLKQPLFRHQLQWADVLESREPRELHPSQTYEAGDPNFVLVNTPPEHAKTATLSINYVTYRLCLDPNVRIILCSKTAERAKEFLYAVKTRLTHPSFEALQEAFGPPGGWREDAAVWTADRIYLGSERDSGEKDPTVQAIGIGGQIYGARSDLIIIDDGIVLSNAHQFETQLRWIQQEVVTRLGPTGRLLIVGTRVDATDLYRVLRQPDRYPDGRSPWTYLSQPAVLEFDNDPAKWVTLWPRAQAAWAANARKGDDGLFPRWDGPHLARRRGMLNPRTWALAYMQADVEEDAVFPAAKVRAAVNGARMPGVMRPGLRGSRPEGMAGLYVLASMDPAMVGDTAVIVYGVDRQTRKRYVLDARLRTSATPAWIKETIQDVTNKYGVAEWRIEANAFQSFLTQDAELQSWLASAGVRLSEHVTGRNKWDSGFGVASMAVIFEQGLVELPSTASHEPTKQLIDQLVTWSPETKAKTDMVMALWFAEIRAREICAESLLGEGVRGFQANRFLSKRRRAQQQVINLNDLAAARQGVMSHAAG